VPFAPIATVCDQYGIVPAEAVEPVGDGAGGDASWPRIPVPAPGVIADSSQEGAAESQTPLGCDGGGPPLASAPIGFARLLDDPKGGGSVPISQFGIQYGQSSGRKNQPGSGI